MTHLLLAVIYLAFISLGLPDSLLGAAWPSMYPYFGVPVSAAGVLSAIIALATILSSLQSDRLTKLLGAGRVTAYSVTLTAAGLFGFSVSTRFWQLCLWAVPYGLGAGSVDASLNSYVALHYPARHTSWLHCMWGLGAVTGPYGLAWALSAGRGWAAGYRYISYLQMALTALLFLSLPLWKKEGGAEETPPPVPLGRVWSIPGVRRAALTCFCYHAVEQTAALWVASYLVLRGGMEPDSAAAFTGLFFLGEALGRGVCGFLTGRFRDVALVRLGQGLAGLGAVLLLFRGTAADLAGLALLGLGCAPIYPSLLHATPARFGPENARAVMGVELAGAYAGACVMPPLFGLVGQWCGAGLLPLYLLALLGLMVGSHEALLRSHRG